MKKLIFISIAALLAMVGCSKVETVDTTTDSPISFKVVNYTTATRADAYSTDDTFGVYAYWTQTSWAADSTSNVFMDNEEVVYGPAYASGEWGPNTQYFWTKTGAITFAAYSPYTSAAGENGFTTLPAFSMSNGFEFDYTVDADDVVDLMIADVAEDQTANNPEYKVSSNTDGVPILFHHKLTKVGFQFLAGENPNPNVTDCYIILKDVKIVNIKNSGSYSSNEWSDQDGSEEYVFNEKKDSIKLVYAENAEAQPTVTDSVRIVLPQVLDQPTATSGDVQQLEITYTIVTTYESNPDSPAEENVTSAVDLYTTSIPEWEPNKRIIYTILINPVSGNPILFDPAVVPWETVTNDEITLPN